MHPFAQGIADFQQPNDLFRERLDHRNLEPEAEISYLRAERLAFAEQRLRARGERMETLQQGGRRLVERKRLDDSARGLERVERQGDGIGVPVIPAPTLQVI